MTHRATNIIYKKKLLSRSNQDQQTKNSRIWYCKSLLGRFPVENSGQNGCPALSAVRADLGGTLTFIDIHRWCAC